MLLATQVVMCALLLTTSLVALLGLNRTLTTRLGFNPDGVYVAAFDLNQAVYDRGRGLAFRARLLEAMVTQPGVAAVTFTSSIPLTTDQSTDTIIGDAPAIGAEPNGLDAKAFKDGKYALPGEPPRPAIFWNGLQAYRPSTQLLVRSALPAAEVARTIRRVVAALDPSLPVTVQGSLREVTSLAFLPAAAAAAILGTLGVLAALLALTGVYALAAYSVSVRTREIGIRLALGARAPQVLRTVFGRIGAVLLVAGSVGVALAGTVGSLLALVVYQASSRDPLILGGAISLLVVIGLIAAAAPARRALRIAPALTMREG